MRKSIDMRFYLIFLSFFLFTQSLYAQVPCKADDCIGEYWSPDKDGKIEIFKRGNMYFGKIIWSKNPGKDINNPDVNLRSRETVGSEFLIGFKFNGEDKWTNGFVYDARSGKTYKCTMWLDKKNYLNIHGYIGISLLGKTANFERIK
jgi:uncharacterized protein (DUF2147 family)